jgi:Caspase domain
VRWAIVIGIDDYGDDELDLTAAVRDAEQFHAWVTDKGGVPPKQAHLLVGRSGGTEDEGAPTKANIVATIIRVVNEAEAIGRAEALYFFFSGHGVTADLAGREESAIVMRGFSVEHPEHSLAVRSLAEHLETTLFEDQFIFIDACRNALGKPVKIGGWPIPRRRDPGKPPVQQFILYATSPGLTAQEVGWPGESESAFTDVLMDGLQGEANAKAWSWERSSYEVRWERLATYVNGVMKQKQYATTAAGPPPADGWPIQIPQDAGSRGVDKRERDAVLASYRRGGFPDEELTLELVADSAVDEEAEVTVLDATGVPVVTSLRVPGSPVTFALPPGTYAARAKRSTLVGSVTAPLELYGPLTETITLQEPAEETPSQGTHGTITVHSHDPLSAAEILDEAGHVVAVLRNGETHRGTPGFYRVRHLRPERAAEADDEDGPAAEVGEGEGDEERRAVQRFVVLERGDSRDVHLGASAPAADVVRLAEALGGGTREHFVLPYAGAEPSAWTEPSTVLAAAIGGALEGGVSLDPLGVPAPRGAADPDSAAVAIYVVVRDEEGESSRADDLSVRVWPLGTAVQEQERRISLQLSSQRVAGAVVEVEPTPHWLSLERGDEATVIALPVLPSRLATVVAQIEPAWMRLYQFHPLRARAEPPLASRQLRRIELLERLLLAGSLDGARPLAEDLAGTARDDPFAGLLAGYVLLRLGLDEQLAALVPTLAESAPTLSDVHILRGEVAAAAGLTDVRDQAFADAVAAGVPMFGEGLTRLVEGLRASAFHHPRGALVRHIFRTHARGSMWAAFRPTRKLTAGQLVISGADLGYEG